MNYIYAIHSKFYAVCLSYAHNRISLYYISDAFYRHCVRKPRVYKPIGWQELNERLAALLISNKLNNSQRTIYKRLLTYHATHTHNTH